jgi:hypothetical protein
MIEHSVRNRQIRPDQLANCETSEARGGTRVQTVTPTKTPSEESPLSAGVAEEWPKKVEKDDEDDGA